MPTLVFETHTNTKSTVVHIPGHCVVLVLPHKKKRRNMSIKPALSTDSQEEEPRTTTAVVKPCRLSRKYFLK